MSNDLEKLIEQAFSDVPPPSEDDLCASVGDEVLEDTEPFRGKKWQDLDADLLASHEDALFYWFTPRAFHYYLPAFLKAGLKEPHANYVLNILLFLRPDVEAEFAAFARKRWKLLNDKQIRALEEWLCSIFPRDDGELKDALKVLRVRYWWVE